MDEPGPATRRFPSAAGLLVVAWLTWAAAPWAVGHDIPNQRVDRSIQVTIRPGRLEVDYEVSLSELTLTQDLRALVGSLPGGDRASWQARYAEVTAPLNAKGLLVTIDRSPVTLEGRGFDLAVEEHPRYTFHYTADIGTRGHLSLRDQNFVSSEGMSRLAIVARDGAALLGEDLPPERVDEMTFRPVWQLTDAEERRTKRVDVDFVYPARSTPASPAQVSKGPGPGGEMERTQHRSTARPGTWRFDVPRLTELLDRAPTEFSLVVVLLAVTLGAVHAAQPGHGKTLVAIAALGQRARLYQPLLVGLATTATHMGSVLLIALGLWITTETRVADLHQGLTRVAGFAVAATGFWRMGRALGGYDEHAVAAHSPRHASDAGLIYLGAAGGLVPCWDAVSLVVIASALGRLREGIVLVIAFSAGMAMTLVAIGLLVWKLQARALAATRTSRWQHRLNLVCGLVLSALGPLSIPRVLSRLHGQRVTNEASRHGEYCGHQRDRRSRTTLPFARLKVENRVA